MQFKARQPNSCEQPFITHSKHLLRHQSTSMHMELHTSMWHKPTIAQLCLQQCKYNQAGNGFYQYFDIYIHYGSCLKTPALSYWNCSNIHKNKTHQKTVTSAKWANHFFNKIYGKMKQHVIVSETKPNHILFKSCKHCCILNKISSHF